MDESVFSIALRSRSLAELLTEARRLIGVRGERHTTQRGITLSLNRVALTWQAPQMVDEPGLPWHAEDVRWYLARFVDKTDETDPLAPPSSGRLHFPYTYAARSRFWDAGWSALQVVLEALREQPSALAEARASLEGFGRLATVLGERLHVQTALALLALYPPLLLAHYLEHPQIARAQAEHWRRDLLASAIADVAANPHSRRAVVGPLGFPHLEDQLEPQMGKPPYQLFQLLPSDQETPIASIHEHRSLDIVGGAQLDFAHDLAWLMEASAALGRPVGDITVVAHNLHEYDDLGAVDAHGVAPQGSEIERWLCRVTDGYRSGTGAAEQMLTRAPYMANLARIYERWRV